jgi:mono/diheme cytochrome c family protein
MHLGFRLLNLLLAATVFAIGTAMVVAHAQQTSSGPTVFDAGKIEYEAHCAACHGSTGEGNGPFSPMLNSAIPNLSTLAKRNGGVFPVVRVYGTIDGREQIAAHGSRDMPIWGPRYGSQIGQGFFGEGTYDDIRSSREALVRTRILLLTEYIYRLQAK